MTNIARFHYNWGKRWMAAKGQCERKMDKREKTYTTGSNLQSQNKLILSFEWMLHEPSIFLWQKKGIIIGKTLRVLASKKTNKVDISPHAIFHSGKKSGQNKKLYSWRISNIWLCLDSVPGMDHKSTPSTAAAGLAERPSSPNTDKQS